MSEELKPCPFCAGKPEIHTQMVSRYQFVSCSKCRCDGPLKERTRDAIACWNRRAFPTPEGQGDAREVMASAICVNRAPCEACRLSAERALTALQAEGMAVVRRASRIPAPNAVENLEASTGDIPKQGSKPQHDLRDAAIVARALAIIMAECDRQKEASNAAGDTPDKYRHNTALHALWAVAGKIGELAASPYGKAVVKEKSDE